jgi:outer membrane lipoprotein-sorting protein
MRLRPAWPVLSLPLVVAFTMGVALAQDGSTSVVRKKPPATGAVAPQQPTATKPAPVQLPAQPAKAPKHQLRPAQDMQDVQDDLEEAPIEAAAPVGELYTPGDEGAGWDAAVQANLPTPLIGVEQVLAVERINAYFNSITNLQGSFEQLDSNNKRTSGRFYVQRPGKLRFDYAPPSALRIVADGHFLAIEDSDLKTVEKYPLKSTPFRLLLKEAVDLGRDARIIGVEAEEGILAIALEDKSGEASGQIKLSFQTDPELQLKQWIITDAQGLTTRVEISDVVTGRKVATDFFSSKDSFQPFR